MSKKFTIDIFCSTDYQDKTGLGFAILIKNDITYRSIMNIVKRNISNFKNVYLCQVIICSFIVKDEKGTKSKMFYPLVSDEFLKLNSALNNVWNPEYTRFHFIYEILTETNVGREKKLESSLDD